MLLINLLARSLMLSTCLCITEYLPRRFNTEEPDSICYHPTIDFNYSGQDYTGIEYEKTCIPFRGSDYRLHTILKELVAGIETEANGTGIKEFNERYEVVKMLYASPGRNPLKSFGYDEFTVEKLQFKTSSRKEFVVLWRRGINDWCRSEKERLIKSFERVCDRLQKRIESLRYHRVADIAEFPLRSEVYHILGVKFRILRFTDSSIMIKTIDFKHSYFEQFIQGLLIYARFWNACK